MGIEGITVAQANGVVRIAIDGKARDFTPAQVWTISHELGACARQAAQHAARSQAEQAGVKSGPAPKIGRQPED